MLLLLWGMSLSLYYLISQAEEILKAILEEKWWRVFWKIFSMIGCMALTYQLYYKLRA
jgi:hypothetical protein